MPPDNSNTKSNGVPFDHSGYNKLFGELYQPLCTHCYHLTGDSDLAEDLVQELFVYVWENWGKIEQIDSPKAYLYTAIKNRSINYLQKAFRKSEVRENEHLNLSLKDSNYPTPQNILESDEAEKILMAAVESLPRKCRAIFTLKRWEELSNKEIAEKLDISIKTVEAQMTIALRKIMEFVKENWILILIILFGIE